MVLKIVCKINIYMYIIIGVYIVCIKVDVYVIFGV